MEIREVCLGLYFEFCKLYAFISISLSNCCKYLVDNSEYVSYIERQRSICIRDLHQKMSHYKIEPTIPWIGIFYNDNSGSYVENVISLANKYDTNEIIGIITNLEEKIPYTRYKTLTMVKTKEMCLSRLYGDNFVYSLDNVLVQKFFLQVLYTHPKMENNIEIIIPKTNYVKNNEILSFSYIERYLKYQEKSYIFDDEYKIKIIDKDLENLELNHNEYIILYEKEYTVNEN